MKKKLLGCIALATLIAGTSAFAQVTVTAPQIDFTDPTIKALLGTQVTTQINQTLTDAAAQVQSQSDISKYDGNQKKLAKGFGNANAYSAQSATLQGYQGYSLFAVSGGFMFGSQLPSLDPNKIAAISDTIANDPDVYAGVAPSVTFVNFGFNAQNVFGFFNKDLGDRVKHFYFNVKFGGLSTSFGSGTNSLDFDSTNFGIGVNYQWLPSVGLLGGLARWRGVNFGSGFLYQSNTINFSTTTKVTQSVANTSTVNGVQNTVTSVITANPKLNVEAKMNTVSIPLEATTSVQFLWLFNLNAGLGADLVFGSSKLTATGASDVTIDSITISNSAGTKTFTNGSGYTVTQNGAVKVSTGTNGAPDLVRARLMTGLGFQVGPVKLDIPVYYYLMSGLAVGITGAIVW
jgi:hypothetical protein